ncbi:MAG: hypothetical protein RR290_02780 [Clostridia bacterium]
MNSFNVKLIINDMCCSKSCEKTIQKETNVTCISQTIQLQSSFTLNVIQVLNNNITVLIQNGSNVILRTIYDNFTSEIQLPCENCQHIISISVDIISKG